MWLLLFPSVAIIMFVIGSVDWVLMTISAFVRDGNKDSAALQVSLRRTTPIVWYDDELERHKIGHSQTPSSTS